MKENTSNRKKILYIITKSNWGGAQRYVFDLATGISDEQYEAVVASGGSGLLVSKLTGSGIRTVALPRLGRDVNLLDDIAVFFDLVRLFMRERPNVIHLNSSKIGGLGALAGRVYNLFGKFKKIIRVCSSRFSLSRHYATFHSSSRQNLFPQTRIIFTAHGFAFNEPRNFFARNVIAFMSWITVILSHHTIAVSETDLRSVSWMWTPFVRKKISVIHNGVGDIALKSRDDARKILLGERADKLRNAFWIGTIAELTANKGLEYGILGVASFAKETPSQDFVYVIAGEGEKRSELEALIEKHGLSDKIFLVGYKEDASSLLAAFDVFLLPSVKEGLPYVLLEAGTAKLPVVSSNVGGIPEIIENNVTGILTQVGESEDIANALSLVLQNKEKTEEMKNVLNKKIDEEFSIKNMLGQIMKVYGGDI